MRTHEKEYNIKEKGKEQKYVTIWNIIAIV